MKPVRFLFLILATSAFAADDAALLRCRAIGDTASRLACYDALPLEGARAAAPASPSTAAPAAASGKAAPSLLSRFGFEQRSQPEQELPSITSTIPGEFEGWGPNTRIKLANGQVWQISDGSTRKVYLDNPKVTIRRGALGSFFLDFENDNRSPRVRRLQ